MDKEARRNLIFVRVFLISAAMILAVSAVGKVIPDFNRCRESPMLGPFQPNVSNDTILGVACLAEFGILGLICFSRRHWIPSLACSLWGGLCGLVHVVTLGSGAMTSCNCLGWFQHVLPLSKEVLSTILLMCAGWLALGGLAAFRLSWQRTRSALVLLTLATICILAGLWCGIRYYQANPYPVRFYDEPGVEPYSGVRNYFYVLCGGVIALGVGLYFFGKRRQDHAPESVPTGFSHE